MTKPVRLFLLTTLSLVFGAGLFAAQSSEAAERIDPAKVQKIEDYINNLGTARARFVQTTHNGTQLVGTFYLARPGKLRFEYDEPIKDFVVADGTFIYFYDAEAGEQTNAPIGQTLADFILRKKLDLKNEITVTDYKDSSGLIQVEMVQTSDPAAGKLVLGFDKDPLTLKKWRIIDAQDLITEVELFYLKTDIKHPDGLFVYKDPEFGSKRRLNK